MRRTPLTAFVFLLLLSTGAAAQMAEILREEFHRAEELGIVTVTDNELAGLDRTLADEKTRVVALQARADRVSAQTAARLLEWVRQGRSLLVYDARLLPYFGMKPFRLEPSMFSWKPEEGELGGRKRDGVATVAMAIRSHPVTTGVGQCTLFLPDLEEGEEGRYGAVEVAGDTVALLQFTVDSPALAALRREGRGLIVYKPLLWTEALSGDRFQSNVLEFAAGFQVPGPAGVGKVGDPPGPQAEYVEGQPATPLASDSGPQSAPPSVPAPVKPKPSAHQKASGGDRVHLHGAPDVAGDVLNTELRFETGSSSIVLDRAQVKTLFIGSTVELDRLVMRDGTVHKGLLLTQELRVGTADGELVLEKSDLKQIDFAEPAAAESRP